MATTQATHYDVTVEETAQEHILAQQDIAALAYALWQERGCPEGSPDEDWFQAEERLKSVAK